jgi:hypothetical protein
MKKVVDFSINLWYYNTRLKQRGKSFKKKVLKNKKDEKSS